jgi:hypothetical protein
LSILVAGDPPWALGGHFEREHSALVGHETQSAATIFARYVLKKDGLVTLGAEEGVQRIWEP